MKPGEPRHRFLAFLLRVFFGGPMELAVKYASAILTFLISPVYYALLWRQGLPTWGILVMGMFFTALTFLALVGVGVKLLFGRALKDESPRPATVRP